MMWMSGKLPCQLALNGCIYMHESSANNVVTGVTSLHVNNVTVLE